MKKIRVNTDGTLRAATVDEQAIIHVDGKTLAPEQTRLRPVTEQAVICTALNYTGHYQQLVDAFHQPPHNQPPRQPVFFIKPVNTLAGHLDEVACPDGVAEIHTGAGLAVVIDRTASRVTQEQVYDYIGGYTLYNDFTLAEDSYLRPPVTSKCLDGYGPVGPYITDRAAIADPHELVISTYLNGALQQTASTKDLRYSIPALIEALTEFMTLAPGAVVVSGFPPGRVAVRRGDEVRVEIAQLGSLTNRII
ncbi:MAG: fumarylacetoacetate hydrolase family protein [Gammaproteobacteria bacterium]|nr:fumarylacetoacetate hydrolase family protein [Gammaproteobacteria bacterium]